VLLQEDAAVYKPDGTLLFKLVKGVVPLPLCRTAWENLREAAVATENRGAAAGEVEWSTGGMAGGPVLLDGKPVMAVPGSKKRFRRVLKDGSLSGTSVTASAQSGIVGYFDRYPRIPYCRLTAYAMNYPERFAAAQPFFRALDAVFAREVPDRYRAQQEAISRTHPDFTIHGTVFTTVTVNRNFRTAVHKDDGDLKAGFGLMTVLEAGRYEGGYLVFPAFRVAADVRTGDVLLSDVHEYHGNTPLKGRPGHWERISCVLYYRERMMECGSAAEELERVKRLRPEFRV